MLDYAEYAIGGNGYQGNGFSLNGYDHLNGGRVLFHKESDQELQSLAETD